MLENLIVGAEGFVKIKDHATGEILVDKKNAVHFGNLAKAIAKSLAWSDAGHIKYMAFGNNGTTIDSSGVIVYKQSNTSLVYDPNASLYQTTLVKEIESGNSNATISYEPFGITSSNYADVVVTVLLGENEPVGQDDVDNSDGTGEFVFDEIALWAGEPDLSNDILNDTHNNNESLMLTHVIFHPVQKSANRIIEIEYTLRIQMGKN